jgi:hypothetical protein
MTTGCAWYDEKHRAHGEPVVRPGELRGSPRRKGRKWRDAEQKERINRGEKGTETTKEFDIDEAFSTPLTRGQR